MPDYLSLWLVPTNKYRYRFQQVINVVTQAEAAQSFIPHLTVMSGFGCANQLMQVAEQSAEELRFTYNKSIRGQLSGVFKGNGEHFHHTLGYKFSYTKKSKKIIESLNHSIQTRLQPFTHDLQPVAKPHISILYKSGLATDRSQAFVKSQQVQIGGRHQKIKFGRLFVVRGARPIQCQQDVAEWEVLKIINCKPLDMPGYIGQKQPLEPSAIVM